MRIPQNYHMNYPSFRGVPRSPVACHAWCRNTLHSSRTDAMAFSNSLINLQLLILAPNLIPFRKMSRMAECPKCVDHRKEAAMKKPRRSQVRDEVDSRLVQEQFWRLVVEVNQKMQSDSAHREFWWGYLKGLSRRYHGSHFSPELHDTLVHRDDPLGEGYRAGLSGEM